MTDLKLGDKVIFVRTIWEGRVGTITKIRPYSSGYKIRVNIPGTNCKALHEYSTTAVKKYEEVKI